MFGVDLNDQLIVLIFEMIKDLPDDARRRLFETLSHDFCLGCGSDKIPCECAE